LQEIKDQIKFYDENKSHLNKAYENNFLVANHDTLQKIEEYTNLKQSIEDIENQLEERILYKRMYQEMIHKYEILTYYSKVILNMYLSLKAISKIMNEITYSWKMFK
jgi:predicted nuclease with TOPRIM domain